MLMAKEADVEKFKFQALIPATEWHRWEEWTQGRGAFNNPQIFTAFLRLFLHMPREVQLKALSGTEEELAEELKRQGLHVAALAEEQRKTAWQQGAVMGQNLILDAQHEHPLKAIEQIVRFAGPEIIRLLSPEDQAKMDEFRRLVGPEEKEPRKRKTS